MATEALKTCITCWWHTHNYHVDEHYCDHPENVKSVDLVTGDSVRIVASCSDLRYAPDCQGKCGIEGKWYKANSVAKAEEIEKQGKRQSTAGVSKEEEWLSKL